ncbi:sensor histidine kinase [Microbacterium lacus]|uniref:sensor histidine kinase n=1 Tax=Microbacterium lacus TaxID=415217 RepID=UPI000C2B7D31|nr:histidine kinase [Microbacterium lacus]
MSAARELVLGPGTRPAEDELRLPRPPGVFRRFWARHPLFADILIAVFALLLSAPTLTIRAERENPPTGMLLALMIGLAILGCVALVWRRRWPVAVFIVTLAPVLLLGPDEINTISGPATVVAIYSIAVYRSAGAAWIALGSGVVALGLYIAIRTLTGYTDLTLLLNIAISFGVTLLLGTLVGANVGNRKRYLEALIDRSRQLLVERDQQAQLAAAAERTRIAREMHDVVSHSLTVIVALSEGASVTSDPERSREASRAVAATARDALAEMRMMLGVLRDDRPADAPLAPIEDGSLEDLVDAARNAGFPVSLSLTGVADCPPMVRQAIRRIVQEGLTNAMRYAHDPRFIRVEVVHAQNELTLSVDNDGSRPDEPSGGGGLGLLGLRERLAHLGGNLEAGMISPDHWRLRARIPLEPPHE